MKNMVNEAAKRRERRFSSPPPRASVYLIHLFRMKSLNNDDRHSPFLSVGFSSKIQIFSFSSLFHSKMLTNAWKIRQFVASMNVRIRMAHIDALKRQPPPQRQLHQNHMLSAM